jgi:predicted Kef-type K+ transport protein
MLQHALQAFLIAGVLSPFSYYVGQAANRLKLPKITGYLISGIICGPYLLGILSQESLTDLSIIEGACLGIIGLAAGAELHLLELNRSKKQVGAAPTGMIVQCYVRCQAEQGKAGQGASIEILIGFWAKYGFPAKHCASGIWPLSGICNAAAVLFACLVCCRWSR